MIIMTMAKRSRAASTAALAVIALAATAVANNSGALAFQPVASRHTSAASRIAAAPSSGGAPFRVAAIADNGTNNLNPREHASVGMAMVRCEASSSRPQPSSSLLFRSPSQKAVVRRAFQKLRRSFTILVASLAFFLSTARVVHVPPAHAAASTAVATATTSSSRTTTTLAQRLNPFRSRTADELIDEYVRDRLFADDAYDPLESTYREAYADYGESSEGNAAAGDAMGAYPTLLAETAAEALGTSSKSASSLIASSSGAGDASRGGVAGSASAPGGGTGDGITSVLIGASDFLQSKLKVSASVSYYILAGGAMLGMSVLPGSIGVVYQGLQRMQLDRSEMKMYGKISDMDATAKKKGDDDDDDEE